MRIVYNIINAFISVNGVEYVIRAGNTGDQFSASFYNPATKKYLRHYRGKLIESDATLNPDYFTKDSSFVPEQKNGRYVFHCLNPGMEDLYICQNDDKSFVVSARLEGYQFDPVRKIVPGDIIFIRGVEYVLTSANNGNPSAVSIKNMKGKTFFRHMGGKLLETDSSVNGKVFADDSSFLPERLGNAFIFHCSNKNMYQVCIALDDTGDFIVSRDRKPYPFLLKYDVNVLVEIDRLVRKQNELLKLVTELSLEVEAVREAVRTETGQTLKVQEQVEAKRDHGESGGVARADF